MGDGIRQRRLKSGRKAPPSLSEITPFRENEQLQPTLLQKFETEGGINLLPQHDRSMVRWFLEHSRPSVDFTAFQSFDQTGSEQEVIDSDAAVMFERLSEVVPEGELAAYSGVQ